LYVGEYNPEEFEGAQVDLAATPLEEVAKRRARSANALVEALTGSESEDEVDDSYLNDVDRRLEVAQYYRELLRSPLFDLQNQSASIVEREIRAFVKERLETLLSIRDAKPAPAQFSEEEAKVLRVLIDKVLRTPGAMPPQDHPAPPPLPMVRKAPAPPENRSATPALFPPRLTPRPVSSRLEEKKRGRKPKAPVETIATSIKKTVMGNDGKAHEIEVPRIQRPAGAIPFPTNMEAATAAASIAGTQAAAKDPRLAAIVGLLKK
jgi:hypothetical protein